MTDVEGLTVKNGRMSLNASVHFRAETIMVF